MFFISVKMVYSVNKLKDNVKKMIQVALAAVNEINENGCIMFGKRARHLFSENEKTSYQQRV